MKGSKGMVIRSVSWDDILARAGQSIDEDDRGRLDDGGSPCHSASRQSTKRRATLT